MAFVSSAKECFLCFKPYERILNSKKVIYEKKIVALIDVWKFIADINVLNCSVGDLRQIVEWAKLHALNIVLQAEWSKYSERFQDSLIQYVELSKFQLAKANVGFVQPCENLISSINRLWQHPVLQKIFTDPATCSSSSEETMKFFRMESAYLTTVRLMKLCEARCEDMAMNLAAAFISSLHLSFVTDEMITATHAQVWFIYDLYIALLYKFRNLTKMFNVFRGLTLLEGLNLVKRFVTKNTKTMKIWSAASEIAKYASQFFICQIAYEFPEGADEILKDLVNFFYILCERNNVLSEFISSMTRISNITNRVGLHKLLNSLETIDNFFSTHFLIEMYVKLITTDINECELFKQNNDSENIERTTVKLAETFCKLSLLLDTNVEVARECILTAFSLKPTEERLKMIEQYAYRSGIFVDTLPTWKCHLHPSVQESDDLMCICSECGDWMTIPHLTRPPENNILLQEVFRAETLKIPQTLCDDLSVCISYSRYQIMSWYQPWNELHRLCVMYLRDPVATKNFITDLKYIDIDYSKFSHIKKEPIDELTGIEKGYDMYLNLNFENVDENLNDFKSSHEPTSANSSLKDFLIKLKPLHITADLFTSPSIVLERHKEIQKIVDNEKQQSKMNK